MAWCTLQKLVVKLERAATAYPFPFAILFLSIDFFVDVYVVLEIEARNLEELDMIGIVAGAASLGDILDVGASICGLLNLPRPS